MSLEIVQQSLMYFETSIFNAKIIIHLY